MPRITFIEDVTLPDQKGGPHYRRGYSPDVSEDEARKWVSSGKAVMGAVAVEKPVEEKPVKIPTFKPAKRRWSE